MRKAIHWEKSKLSKTFLVNSNSNASIGPIKIIVSILLAGSYEIRLSQTKSGTLILKGEMVPLEDESKYEFEYSKAWELDKEENRNPISIEELNPRSKDYADLVRPYLRQLL